MPRSHDVGLARWCSGGMVWLDRAAVGSLASVWSLDDCGLIPGSRGVGLAQWCGGGVVWLDRAAMGTLASGLMRRWGGVNGL